MAHLLRQMYVDEIDFEAVTIEKIVDLVFTEMIHDKMQQLEKEELAKQDQTDGNHGSRFKKCSEVLDHEERWITHALSLLNHEVMWQGIVKACKILKYPEPTAMHRDYFETLFDMSCYMPRWNKEQSLDVLGACKILERSGIWKRMPWIILLPRRTEQSV